MYRMTPAGPSYTTRARATSDGSRVGAACGPVIFTRSTLSSASTASIAKASSRRARAVAIASASVATDRRTPWMLNAGVVPAPASGDTGACDGRDAGEGQARVGAFEERLAVEHEPAVTFDGGRVRVRASDAEAEADVDTGPSEQRVQ